MEIIVLGRENWDSLRLGNTWPFNMSHRLSVRLSLIASSVGKFCGQAWPQNGQCPNNDNCEIRKWSSTKLAVTNGILRVNRSLGNRGFLTVWLNERWCAHNWGLICVRIWIRLPLFQRQIIILSRLFWLKHWHGIAHLLLLLLMSVCCDCRGRWGWGRGSWGASGGHKWAKCG